MRRTWIWKELVCGELKDARRVSHSHDSADLSDEYDSRDEALIALDRYVECGGFGDYVLLERYEV